MRFTQSRITRTLVMLAISGCLEGTGSGLQGISGGNGGGSGASASIAFVTQPGTANTGQIIPAVQVVARDTLGQTDSTFTASVTVSLTSNTTGGALSGTTTRTAVNGIVTFGDLRVDKAGTYTLTASTSGLPAITSAAFTITTPTGP
jgi:hypothetical protein